MRSWMRSAGPSTKHKRRNDMSDQITALDERELEQAAGGRFLGPTFVYVLQEGDSLSLLAQRFGTTVRVLRELNDISEPNAIRPSTRLLIPQR
ncbi:MAG: LysM peptidoglycan-binding domain-containing protein [Oscillospiraceae bacterium]|nr:LysM peptidoglycan-binding domain-containing protein [Oscillospiraceae bacterium]